MMRIINIALLLLLSMSVGFANSSDEKVAASKELMQLFQLEKYYDQVFDQAAFLEMEKFRESEDSKEAYSLAMEKMDEIIAKTKKKFTWQSLEEMLIEVYMEVYTTEEIKGLVAFYKTPLGQKFISKKAELSAAVREKTVAVMMKILPQMKEEFKELTREREEQKKREAEKRMIDSQPKSSNLDTKQLEALQKIGFKRLSKAEYLKIMEDEYYQYTKYLADNIWFIYEGDLKITPEEVKLFSGVSFLITGNLTIDGVFDYQDVSALFVLGDVRAKSILLRSSTCYFAKTAYFDDALIIMKGNGAPVTMNNVSGPFVYVDSDAAEFEIDDKVEILMDYVYIEYVGEVTEYLDSRFYEIEDEIVYVDSAKLSEAIAKGENFQKSKE